MINAKINEAENKVSDNSNHITTQDFNKLTAKYFAASLKQADLVNKIGFYNKLTIFNTNYFK